jgi:hypothetical protein
MNDLNSVITAINHLTKTVDNIGCVLIVTNIILFLILIFKDCRGT